MKNLLKGLFVLLLGSVLLVGTLSFSAPISSAVTLQCPAHIADCNYCPGSVLWFGDQCTTVNGRCRDLGTCITPDFYFYTCAGTPGPCD